MLCKSIIFPIYNIKWKYTQIHHTNVKQENKRLKWYKYIISCKQYIDTKKKQGIDTS